MLTTTRFVLLSFTLTGLAACGGGDTETATSSSSQSTASVSQMTSSSSTTSSSNAMSSISSINSSSSKSSSSSNSNSKSSSNSSSVLSSSSASSTANTACAPLAQRWKQTIVSITGNAKPNDEYTPAILTPLSSGESLLAWSDAAASKIHLMKLNNQDQSGGNLPDLDGLEIHSAIETSNGFAMAVMDNDPDIYSAKYCKSSATPDKSVCGKMDLVLLDENGNLKKRTTLTEKGNVDSVGAQFIWWYGHTARLATNGPLIMAYFRSAMSTARDGVAGEVDIHAGDTLKFIDSETGNIQPGGWEWGCSHSWSVRAAHNGTTWGAACHGDAYPNAMQLVRRSTPTSSSSTIQWLNTEDPTKRALGGLVPANNGFWLNYIQNENSKLTLKLGRFNDSLSQLQQSLTISAATNLDSSYPFRVYMAAYGNDQLLLGWKSAGKLVIAVADATTGEILDGPTTTTLSIDNFQEIISAKNGDVIWAHSSGGNKIAVNRISSCNQP